MKILSSLYCSLFISANTSDPNNLQEQICLEDVLKGQTVILNEAKRNEGSRVTAINRDASLHFLPFSMTIQVLLDILVEK